MSLFLAHMSVLAALLSSLVALSNGQRAGLLKAITRVMNAGSSPVGSRYPSLAARVDYLFAPDRFARIARIAPFALLAVSGGVAVLAGGIALLGGDVVQDTLPFGLPWLIWHTRIDSLSGFFLLVLGIPLIAVSLFGPGYVREFEQGKYSPAVLGFFTGLFVAGMEGVLLADDAFFFVVAWEVMSVASYFLVTFQHEHAANRRAGFLYLLMAEIGAIAIILAFGVLASFGGGFNFDVLRDVALTPSWASVAFVLGLVGFGMKAGLVPLHAWLPEAHPAAPSHISALMSGVMLKVAVYGFIRFTFDLLGELQWSWGVVVLVIGTASSVLGVLYAIMQHNLKRLLAYHSVENIGIIFMGLGLSILFFSNHLPSLGALGLVAALLHSLNHALFKSLLFLGAGSIVHQSHETDTEHMGGLIHRMPKTAAIFLIGCISISALPPLNGFVSEWLIFQAALQASALESGVLRSLIPASAAALALAGALAAACFVKVFGVVFLGLPRSRHAAHAHEVHHRGMLTGPALLAAFCVLLGVLPTPLVNALGGVTGQLTGESLPGVSALGWLWLTPVAPEVSSYAPPLVLLLILAVVWLCYYLLYRRPGLEPRRAEPWDCGFGGLTARMQYTSGAFSMPLRRIFQPVFDLRETIDERTEGPGQLRVIAIRHHLHVSDRTWPFLYAPAAHAINWLARWTGRIQTGSIRTYLAYSFFTLLILLWWVN